jgi:tetratricopeptide (TPR) repeat protein
MKITIEQAMATHQEGQFKEAEQLYRSLLKTNPANLDANNNLGVLLLKLRRFTEAEEFCKKAIEHKPEFAEAYNNLGVILEHLDKGNEAEICYKKAIWYKPDLVDAHKNLETLLRNNKILLNISNANDSKNNNKIKKKILCERLNSNPFISFRSVEDSLIKKLYNVKLKQLDKTKSLNENQAMFNKGPLYGNGKTTDFDFFLNNFEIIKNVEKDLITIMKSAVNSEIYIRESFFNIFQTGTGSVPHSHISNFDKIKGLIEQKFSLQYYLSVGDQDCKEPGIFKLKDPDEEILPTNGMVLIIPANRKHSAFYNGKTDRVMIGVNFYSIL